MQSSKHGIKIKFFLIFNFFIKVQLICNVMEGSGIQHSSSVTVSPLHVNLQVVNFQR